MVRSVKKSLDRSHLVAYLSIVAALISFVALTVWGAYRDLRFLRSTLLQEEISKLRSHAERTVGRIERDLETGGSRELQQLERDGWLGQYWRRLNATQSKPLYAAIVDQEGNVLLHSQPSHEGNRLPRMWYSRVMSEVGDDVVETGSDALTSGKHAYDVRVPIVLDGREIGEYHVGLDVSWFRERSATREGTFLRQRAVFVVGALAIVLLAGASLYFVALRSGVLRKALRTAHLERAVEISNLAAGLAHEIRNPLNAVRLNLHAFRRAYRDESQLTRDEVAAMIDESNTEIEYVERLMHQLLGFAAPDEACNEDVDLMAELDAVLSFVSQEMARSGIQVCADLSQEQSMVRIDPARLRQIMLNLLMNAKDAVDKGGQIGVKLSRAGGQAEITVTDDGPGISEQDRERIFEPFYSTREGGSGLGLALVKRFVNEAGGSICCEVNGGTGATFRIRLPECVIGKSQTKQR